EPEAVIPLSRARGMGFGGGGQTYVFNLNGGAYTTEQGLRELAEHVGRIFTRQMRMTTTVTLGRT
ncbi:MAG: hypothetical protein ACRDUA_11055, partial [Micromonosporaceae bacterium]